MKYFLLFIGCVVAANAALTIWGIVPVGFGLVAPAGVFFAGATFTARDFLHNAKGRGWVVGAILLGAAVSALVSPTFALASGTAFLLSEFSDYAVYSPLRQRSWLSAVVASNTVGAVVDSVVFLALAFGSLDFLLGQVIGKTWVTMGFVLCVWAWRAVSQRR